MHSRNFTVCLHACAELRADERDCIPCFSLFFFFFTFPLSVVVVSLLCSFSNLSTSILHRYCRRFYIFRDLFILFFLFTFPRVPTPPAVYLRSANARNGCTEVTVLADVQRTMRTRVGLRGRELQTIAGLRDNVIAFVFIGETDERMAEKEVRAR